MNYGEKINELLFDRKITPKKLSEDLGVSLSTVYRWKNNQTQLILPNLVALADYFRCSVDFLIGISEDMSDFEPKKCPPFSARLRAIMQEKGISSYKLRNRTRYDSKYFQKWDSGSVPKIFTLIELAIILDCSVDYLIGRE